MPAFKMRSMVKSPLKNTTIRLSPEHRTLIDLTGRSVSEIVREALDLYFFTNGKTPDRNEIKSLVKSETRSEVAKILGEIARDKKKVTAE